MPGEAPDARERLAALIRDLEAAPAGVDGPDLAHAVRHLSEHWRSLFQAGTATFCAASRPDAAEAPLVFGPCPAAGNDLMRHRWLVAHGRLFLHYAPLAAEMLGPASRPGERAATLLVHDAVRLLGAHAAGAAADTVGLAAPAKPFASLVGRPGTPHSVRSCDVNLGAVAQALAIESGLRHCLRVPAEARVSMWRIFRALAAEAAHVRLAIALPVLVAVYNWAGRHRRAGARDYGWLNYFAADLLHPLFVPQEPLGFGLSAEPEVLARLRAAALADGVEAPGFHDVAVPSAVPRRAAA